MSNEKFLLVAYVLIVALAATLTVVGGVLTVHSEDRPTLTLADLSQEPPESKATPSKQERVRWGSPSPSSLTSLYVPVGIAKGFYQAEGIDIKFEVMNSTINIAGLSTGEVDYASVLGPIMQAAGKGLPIRVVAVFVERPLFILVARPDIDSVQALKDKTVAITSVGALEHGIVREGLRQHGLDPNTVRFVSVVDASVRFTNLLNGVIDAASVTPPFNVMAKQKGFKELIFLADAVGEVPQNGLSTSESKMRSSPEQIKKVIRATLKAIRYIRENRQEMINFIMERFNLPQELAAGSYDTLLKGLTKDGTISDKGLTKIMELEKEAAKLKGAILPISRVADSTLLREVQRELGLAR